MFFVSLRIHKQNSKEELSSFYPFAFPQKVLVIMPLTNNNTYK